MVGLELSLKIEAWNCIVKYDSPHLFETLNFNDPSIFVI